MASHNTIGDSIMGSKPWEIFPELQKEHLCLIAKIIKDVRNKTVELYDPNEGDGPWSLGCRAYERILNIICLEAEKFPWLSIYRENLYFVMMVNNIPIRFYRGAFDKPTKRTLRRKFPENIDYHQLNFDFETDREWAWRISVDTEPDGSVFSISIAQYDYSGNYQNKWDIPLEDTIPNIASVEDLKHDAVVLGKPKINKKSDKSSEEPLKEKKHVGDE